MRILLISQYFHPESFKCNDVAAELVRRGHEVTVLTGIPNYPKGRFYAGYGLLHRRRETWCGAHVHRAWLVPRGRGGGLRLAANYLSYALSSSLRVLRFRAGRRFDAVVVHETSPVTVGIPGVLASRLWGCPMYFWVLDLWPESLTAAGGVTNAAVLGFFERLTRWIYRHSRRILISSRGFRSSIEAKGIAAEKIAYFPNWPDTALRPGASYALPALPDGFIVMFAGNIGEAQDFEHVMQAALALRGERGIHFVLVGDGRKRPWVERFVADNALEATVHLVGRHPLEAMPAFFARASLMLVSLKDEPIFSLTAPAKLQAYMSAGRPVAAMLGGEGARIVEEAGCGFAVPAADGAALAAAVRCAAQLPAAELAAMGERGRAYCREHFDFRRLMDRLCNMLRDDTGKD